ncbi:unnamed protein product [Urochloa decumbens]|uniref:Protein kinase domain-containing protein n=1 Tax=Urochloa decumbens TaxID=240449 RepID=A0ABC9CSE5_9POAL
MAPSAAVEDRSWVGLPGWGGPQGKLPRGHPLLQGIAGRTIAVKRLRRTSDIPEIIISYFTREMQVISGLKQHQNVLRLLAYCNEDSEQILVYEYMHRRSLDLDAYIFEVANSSWDLGGRQAPALHEGDGSTGNVIHRGLKPTNVLLDGGWNAKVADKDRHTVGKSLLISNQLTLHGYMAPEYVQSDGGETTLKCDVCSFGVTTTLSKVTDRQASFQKPGGCLLDPVVIPAPARGELPLLRRCIQVGLLCVQQQPDDRPAMFAVVEMLSSSSSELIEPTVPMVGNKTLAAVLEVSDLSRLTVYETIDFT